MACPVVPVYEFEHSKHGCREFRCSVARYNRLSRILSRFGWARVYSAPSTITETGGVHGPADRLHRDTTGAKLEHLYNSQRETQRETGNKHGPFRIKDWQL